MERQTGATTQQMQAAPHGAVFIWCNGHLRYPQELAKKLGRPDLQIVGPAWLEDHRWAGRELAGLVVDHAAHGLSDRARASLEHAFTRVRQNAELKGGQDHE